MKRNTAIDKDKSKLLEALYDEYSKLVYYTAYTILRDHPLSEDTVQSVFLRLSEKNFKIETISCNKTRAFLVIITRHIAIDLYNIKKKENTSCKEEEMENIEDRTPLVDIVINNETLLSLQKVLSLLDSKYSEVILMRYYYGYKPDEIASLFGISEQLVRVRLHRAKKLLLMKIDEEKRING